MNFNLVNDLYFTNFLHNYPESERGGGGAVMFNLLKLSQVEIVLGL